MSIKIKYAQRALARAKQTGKAAKLGTLQMWQNQLAALKRASEKQEPGVDNDWDSDTWQQDANGGRNSQSIYPFLP